MPTPTPPVPEPPYYAVIFTSTQTPDTEGYGEMAERMLQLAATQEGFLGFETARGADGLGITVSYWRDLDAIDRWRRHAEHLEAQRLGTERWYARYTIRVARVERSRTWARE